MSAESLKKTVKKKDSVALEKLLQQDTTGINEPDHLGQTPLMYSVMVKDEDCLRVLLKYGADQSIRNLTGQTAYDMANTDNLKRLLNPEMTAKLTVKKAIDNGDPEALRTLLSQQEGKINLPIDYTGLTPLMYASREGKQNMVRLLIELGADESLKDETGHTAYDLAPVSLRHSNHLNPAYSTKLILVVAVREGDSEKLKEILEADRSAINQKDSAGDTPLIQAIRVGHLGCVRVLLAYGADETIRDMKNLSPYDIASDDIRPLLNAANSTYVSVRQAILADDPIKLRNLLHHNSSLLNEQDDMLGLTLLMFAVIKDREECVKELISLGADQSIRDSMGHTAFDRASPKLKKYLKSKYSTLQAAFSRNIPDYYKDFDSIYATPENDTHVDIDHEKTVSKGSEQLIFGSFVDKKDHQTKRVAVKLKRNGRHLASESLLYGLMKKSSLEKYMLTCYNGYDQTDPNYLVLEDFGSDLTSAHSITYEIRSTILVPQIIEALTKLHLLGIVHGDIKPENILVSSNYCCKLCDFDSACRVNDVFPRTPQGDLKFSFCWVSPEIFKVYEEERKSHGRQQLVARPEMDIFPLGLIIDLLSRKDLMCREMMTVLPNPTLDTTDHSLLRKYLSNQQELNSLIYCFSHDHAYRHLVEPMVSISPQHRQTMQYHMESMKEYTLTGAYRKTKQQQSELEILQSFRENLTEFLDQHHVKTTESSSLQWKYLESQIMTLIDTHQNNFQQLVEKMDILANETMTSIQDTWKDVASSLSSQSNSNLEAIKLTLQGRFDSMEAMSLVPTSQGSLNASLVTEMNICLVKLAQSMEQNNEKSYQKLCVLERNLLAQKDQLNEIKNNLHESHLEQMRASDNVFLKLETLEMVMNNSFQDFHLTIDSIQTNEELQNFCTNVRLEIENRMIELFDGFEKKFEDKSTRSQSRLENIQEEMLRLTNLSMEGQQQNERKTELLRTHQLELHDVLNKIDKRLQSDKEEFETKLLNLKGVIIDSIFKKLDDTTQSLTTHIDSGVEKIIPHLQDQNLEEILNNVKAMGNDLKLTEQELSKLIKETNDKVQGVRNFQDLSAFNAHNHPLLFILSEERVKDGVISSIMDAANQIVRQGYRLHFLCTVCGKMAPSGRHGGRDKSKHFWDRVRNHVSHIELDQGGYRLMITHRWVEDFLIGMKWVLRALQFAGKLSGLPLPHLSEFLDFLPIPESFRELSDEVLTEVRDLTRGLCELTDDDRSREGRDILNDESDDSTNGIVQTKKLKEIAKANTISNYQSLITAEDLKRHWAKHRPKVSLTDVKRVKQLLEFVGDHEVEHTGLRRCLRSLDGTCAWVCESNDRSLMCGHPQDTRSCYELYQAEGSNCCLIDLNYV